MSTVATRVNCELLNQWANDASGPVALHLRQTLLPVEGEGGVIFPPTYADIGYNIDTLADGRKGATIDSVGSQANRMEPLFKSVRKDDNNEINPLAELVPQIEIILKSEETDGKIYERKQSLLDLAHRSADAVVKATPGLRKHIDPAFEALNRDGNAWHLCALAPTSLLFGVWDSRDGTGVKLPRLIRAMIRAWDVEVLHSAAQFNSVWKALDPEQRQALEKEAKANKTKLSEKGFSDAPSVFRTDKVAHFVNNAPNPEARVLGGVLVKGPIERTVTVNLIALRALKGGNDEQTKQIHKYLLYLALIAATSEFDLFLREGCLLRYADAEDEWIKVPRRGEPRKIELPDRDELLKVAKEAVKPFQKDWPTDGESETKLAYRFDIKKAKELLSKKSEEEAAAS